MPTGSGLSCMNALEKWYSYVSYPLKNACTAHDPYPPSQGPNHSTDGAQNPDCVLLWQVKPGLSSFLENFISPYTCKYMCFISRGWGHGLLGKVPTSKHENLNSITDAHIKKTGYRYEPVSEHWGRRPAGQSVQSNQLAFSSAAIPVSKSKVQVLRRRLRRKNDCCASTKTWFQNHSTHA